MAIFLSIFKHILVVFDIFKQFVAIFNFFGVFRQFLAIFEKSHLVTLFLGATPTNAHCVADLASQACALKILSLIHI